MSDIRKWFMKQHDKNNGSASKAKPDVAAKTPASTPPQLQKPVANEDDSQKRRKTSRFFADTGSESISKGRSREEVKAERAPKRKCTTSEEKSDASVKHPHKRKLCIDEDDNEFVMSCEKRKLKEVEPAKKSKRETDEDEENEVGDKEVGSAGKSGGRGRGGRGAGATAGRGRGGGRGGFMNFGERNPPPHKGEKEIPEGATDCLAGLTFVISGTLDSLEREEAEDLIKRHGGRVTGSVSKKTDYLLADEDIGGRKSAKAKEVGTKFLTEDGLFHMILKSKPAKSSLPKEMKRENVESPEKQLKKGSPHKGDIKSSLLINSTARVSPKTSQKGVSPSKLNGKLPDITWTEKYKPKATSDIVGNQSLVKQLHDWLAQWNQQFLHSGQKVKGKKQSDSGAKKAVLLSGPPGIGKTTSAKLVSQMLSFQSIEVNASDNRGKADSKIMKGIGGSTSNSVKELVSNESLKLGRDWSKHPKTVLIMDEVDGMSAGDRGGVADLIASIKVSKIPIICICNDRYSQKLKSLVNYCLLLNYRKPTKQQMAKRLSQIAAAEGLKVNEIALEELADRVNGDMRMAINQLQYMSLSKSIINYDDIRQRLLNSSKDEDISPFTAVDKLFGYDGGKLRMDERIDLCMSDPDLVPLIIQENYLNYRPLSSGKDDSGTRRMDLIARAAESIGNGDIINVQIRRYRQWQLSQAGTLASSIIPASLLHGSREVLEQGERNFNRFGGWLGKNSTTGKNVRLLQDTHDHILASQETNLDRDTLRTDYFPIILKQLTDPLRLLSKEAAVQQIVGFMDTYSLSQEDYDFIVELSKFQGRPSPLDGIPPAVKSALTKAYKQGSSNRIIRSADLITLPGLKKAPKKRIAAILEPLDDAPPEADGAAALENEEENDSETEEAENDIAGVSKVKLDLESNRAKGIQVQLELKNSESSSGKKKPTGRSKGSESSEKKEKGSSGTKRKK